MATYDDLDPFRYQRDVIRLQLHALIHHSCTTTHSYHTVLNHRTLYKYRTIHAWVLQSFLLMQYTEDISFHRYMDQTDVDATIRDPCPLCESQGALREVG